MNTGKSTTFFEEYERIGLVISVLLHLILLFFMLSSRAPHTPIVDPIEVTIEPSLPTSPKKQIVSPSSQPSTTPPLDTSRLSEHDSKTETEQIRRGETGGAPGQPVQSQPAPQKPQEKSPQSQQVPETKKSAPQTQKNEAKSVKHPAEPPAPTNSRRELNLRDLKLDDATLALKFGSTGRNPAEQKPTNSQQQNLSEYQAFSRPPGSGAAFLGNGGISDHLPNLPDGDITLLNAKANTYAGFVRRVAVQVFTQLRSQGWEKLSQQQINRMTDFTTIEAILSPQGKFIKAQLVESSGSEPFDAVVNLSVTNGSSDPNPPEGARAKDGNIHFIFRARSWSQIGVNRRSGAPTEQRWLLLATGLE